MNDLQIGDVVKIRRDTGGIVERFWVEVTKTVGGRWYAGRVDNHLLGSRYKCGDEILFSASDVIARYVEGGST